MDKYNVFKTIKYMSKKDFKLNCILYLLNIINYHF